MAAESTLLTANREELVKNIRLVEPFLDKLLQTNQLATEECEVVRSGRTPQDRARALIDLVGTKGQEAFGHFRYALKETNPELADILHRCTEHNEKIKLHCDDCVQLLCRTCNKEGHKGHSVASIVAEASAIRREVTAFVRENRKLLKHFKASGSDVGGRQTVLMDIEIRKRELKAMFIATIESEYEWCKDQLGIVESVASPVASISSVATTEDESSGRIRTESPRSPKVKVVRGVRNHPYSRLEQNDRASQARSPAGMQHLVSIMPIRSCLPTHYDLAFTAPTSLSPSQSPSQDLIPTLSSPSQNLYSSSSTSTGFPFANDPPSVRNTPTSRSPLSPISFSDDNNSLTQGFRHPAPSFHGQRESSSQLRIPPPSPFTSEYPWLRYPMLQNPYALDSSDPILRPYSPLYARSQNSGVLGIRTLSERLGLRRHRSRRVRGRESPEDFLTFDSALESAIENGDK